MNNCYEYARSKAFLGLLLLLLACGTAQRQDRTPHNLRNPFHPGHYVAVEPFFELAEIKHLDEPALRGINKRYHWRTLEPDRDAYDLSTIEQDLDYCAAHNKQLIVFLIDRAFWKKGALPTYLQSYEIYDPERGFRPQRWKPEYVDRFVALGKAIGDRFDAHPNFEGVAIQETALDMSEAELTQYEYTPERYRDALIAILNGLQAALPRSRVFWYQNGLHDNAGHIRQIADTVARSRVVMGGPDILPYRRWLRHTYKIYGEYQDKLPLFCSAQDDSYQHHKNDVRLGEDNPIHPEGYLTMEDIFLYARDSMHVQYLFWNYYYEGEERGARSFDDAILVIRKYPRFNFSP